MRDAIQMQIENNQVTSIVRSQIANYIQGVKATLKHPVQTQCLKMSHLKFSIWAFRTSLFSLAIYEECDFFGDFPTKCTMYIPNWA